ncbi:hypothetical protein L596_007396 [Steinernema carpocapsae]|uniref:HMG box domain-containing protein n=1 Tax=Steinernema carpocapsae TaxID=34508 RepID=A0A4U5P958_STECR|nr:hypothetical protein L596_007396 [Steinernema carpocapsae]
MARPKKNGSAEKEENSPVQKVRRNRMKLPKDKNAPKRPANGFVQYVMERRPMIEKDSPGIRNADLMKMAAVEWKEMDGTIKQRYTDRAEKDMEEWNKKVQEYQKSEEYREHQRKVNAVKADKSKEDKEAKGRKRKVRLSESDNVVTMAGTSQIKVFSDEFLLFNKEQERELRALRKTYNSSVHEEELLCKSNANAERHNEELLNDIKTNEELIEMGRKTVQRWERVLKDGLKDAHLPQDVKTLLNTDFDAFIEKLESYHISDIDDHPVLSVVCDSIINLNFD